MKTIALLTLVAACAAAVTACHSNSGVGEGGAPQTVVSEHAGSGYTAKTITQSNLGNREKIAYESSGVQESVSCSGLQERIHEDGRLEVAANLHNHNNKRIQLQVSCVFKDFQGFSTGDEAPWQTLIMTENSQETVRFISMNDKAKLYTIRLREAR